MQNATDNEMVDVVHLPPPTATQDEDGPIEVSGEHRTAAHRALDAWLDDCTRHGAATFESGQGGYIGRMKLWAFVSDDGVSLRIDRSLLEDL